MRSSEDFLECSDISNQVFDQGRRLKFWSLAGTSSEMHHIFLSFLQFSLQQDLNDCVFTDCIDELILRNEIRRIDGCAELKQVVGVLKVVYLQRVEKCMA